MQRFTTSDPAEELQDGVRLIGRWHTPATTAGVVVIEADNFGSAMGGR